MKRPSKRWLWLIPCVLALAVGLFLLLRSRAASLSAPAPSAALLQASDGLDEIELQAEFLPGGADCAIFPENDHLLGLIVQCVPTAAQNRPPDAQRQLDVAAHRVPSALYHLKNPLHHLERKWITMEHEKILRINELAKIKKERSLTADEEEERKALHQEYIAGFRQNMEAVLQNVRVKQPDGSLTPLKKKADKLH